MTRRTRTLEFFASSEEARLFLRKAIEQGLYVFAVNDSRTVRFDADVPPSARDCNTLLIGETPDVGAEAHRQPARWGLVVFKPPRVIQGELRLGDLGAVNVWEEQGQGFSDDKALRLFDRLRKLIMPFLSGSVDVSSPSTGASRHYPNIRTTALAEQMWSKGTRFAQEGVAGLDYRPHGSD